MMKELMSVAGLAFAGLMAAAGGAAAGSGPVEVQAALDRGVLKAGETQKVYVRIGLVARKEGRRERAPMNLALVIDRSGSMSGPRIEAARNAALMAVDRLGRDDILSVVSYDDRIEVEVPATKLTDPGYARDRIRRLTARGSTAIYSGLQAGASELRKFKSRERVNRIILLSDGLANVGPSRPEDFAGLGRELASEGITVSTVGLGLGYNEDLMSRLAQAADGSHAFVQEPADLAQFFAREFDDALATMAQEVEIIITCKPGVKPMRSLGREARIEGEKVAYRVSQIYANAEQVLVAELEVAAATAGDASELVSVEVNYNPAGESHRVATRTAVSARYGSQAESDASANADVLKDVVVLKARADRQEATRLRDAGRIDEAKRKFEENAQYLRGVQAASPVARSYDPIAREIKANEAASAPAAQSTAGWERARKVQKEADSNVSGGASRY